MTGRELTKKLLLIVPGLILLYDGVMYVVCGNDATISKILLDTNETCATISYMITLSLGVLIGHFYLPQHIEQEKGDMEDKPKRIFLENQSVAIGPEVSDKAKQILDNRFLPGKDWDNLPEIKELSWTEDYNLTVDSNTKEPVTDYGSFHGYTYNDKGELVPKIFSEEEKKAIWESNNPKVSMSCEHESGGSGM